MLEGVSELNKLLQFWPELMIRGERFFVREMMMIERESTSLGTLISFTLALFCFNSSYNMLWDTCSVYNSLRISCHYLEIRLAFVKVAVVMIDQLLLLHIYVHRTSIFK